VIEYDLRRFSTGSGTGSKTGSGFGYYMGLKMVSAFADFKRP